MSVKGYKYSVQYAPTGRATCKFCGKLIKQGSLRVSRETGPIAAFGGDASLVQHYHWKHAFEVMKKLRCTSNIMSSKNTEIYSTLNNSDQKALVKELLKIKKFWKNKCKKSVSGLRSKNKSKSRSRSKSRTIYQ